MHQKFRIVLTLIGVLSLGCGESHRDRVKTTESYLHGRIFGLMAFQPSNKVSVDTAEIESSFRRASELLDSPIHTIRLKENPYVFYVAVEEASGGWRFVAEWLHDQPRDSHSVSAIVFLDKSGLEVSRIVNIADDVYLGDTLLHIWQKPVCFTDEGSLSIQVENETLYFPRSRCTGITQVRIELLARDTSKELQCVAAKLVDWSGEFENEKAYEADEINGDEIKCQESLIK